MATAHVDARGGVSTRADSEAMEADLLLNRPALRRTVAVGALLLIAVVLLSCSDPQTTTDPKSDNTETIQSVYLLITILAVIVMVGVLSAILVLSIAFRERPGREAKQFHGNTRLEILWTLIPVVIVVIISVPTFAAIAKNSADPPDDALRVIATGHQWWFEFEYPDEGVVTANELHIPVDRAISVTLLSDDVIHSFWIPQLVGKVDIVPGHANSLWFTPNEVRDEAYLGQCAEFCGTAHANMRFRVYVDTPEDFAAWLELQRSEAAEPDGEQVRVGQELFLTNACIGCHTIRGTAAAGVIGPDLTHVGGRATIASGILDNTEPGDLERWIANPNREKPGVVLMPAVEEQLTAEEIAAIATYLRSLK